MAEANSTAMAGTEPAINTLSAEERLGALREENEVLAAALERMEQGSIGNMLRGELVGMSHQLQELEAALVGVNPIVLRLAETTAPDDGNAMTLIGYTCESIADRLGAIAQRLERIIDGNCDSADTVTSEEVSEGGAV